MGLGKTLEALALMGHTKERGLTDDPWLVVAPTSVVGNWAAECRRFAPDLTVATVTETEKRRGVPLAEVADSVDLVITSYSLFRLEYDGYAEVAWAGMFLDEAQFAKNRQSQTYQRAKLLPAPFKVCMTGTPIENNLMELWSLLSIAAPGLFTSPDRFAEYYRVPIERNADADRLAQLRRRVRPLMLRRTKEQVASDLPDKQEQVLELDLNPRHQKIYQTHLQRERQKILGLLGDMQKNRMAIFSSLTLLRQASLDVSLIDEQYSGVPSTKLDALMEMLDDIVEDGHRVLVFSQFTRFLGLARARLAAHGIDHCYLDGRTRRRDAVIDRVPHRVRPGVSHQPESRRVRAQPDRGRLLRPARPLVESGHRSAGGGPDPPHRPDPQGDGLPTRGQGHHRREGHGPEGQEVSTVRRCDGRRRAGVGRPHRRRYPGTAGLRPGSIRCRTQRRGCGQTRRWRRAPRGATT